MNNNIEIEFWTRLVHYMHNMLFYFSMCHTQLEIKSIKIYLSVKTSSSGGSALVSWPIIRSKFDLHINDQVVTNLILLTL